MIAVTLDAGAFIAMERRKERGTMLLRAAKEHRVQLLATTPTVAEWWRGDSEVRSRIKLAVTLVPLPVRAAEAAGVALGALRGVRISSSLTVAAMVMAFAALYGGAVVYTSDPADLEKFSGHFPNVRLLSV